MKVTIGITTFNRFKYAKSLLKSLESLRDISQIIVVDNCSTENGLREHLSLLKNEGMITDLFLRDPKERNWVNDEYIAKNIIIENSKSDVILFLQDDLQYVFDAETFSKVLEDFRNEKEFKV